ncbi:uncharacterized protein LOC135831195 [Planococcus citri]|uniref:uncharacterized protein LOC135831195 n=1 Tax=Planococcus citri TaxID=170843 RepID=UPI0031FA3A4B
MFYIWFLYLLYLVTPIQNKMPGDGEVLEDANDQQQLHVARVAIKCPPFWKINPRLWFAQIESQFSNANIVSDLTKYNTVVGHIESEILNAVSDIVLNPPNQGKYETLKTRLIESFADSEDELARKLLQTNSNDDSKPSQILKNMKERQC